MATPNSKEDTGVLVSQVFESLLKGKRCQDAWYDHGSIFAPPVPYTSPLIKIAPNISYQTLQVSCIEQHIYRWILFMRHPPRHHCLSSFTDMH